MQRTALVMLGLWLLGPSLAVAQELPEGTFASSTDGCTRLTAKTAAELGEELDFYVLTKAGITAHGQKCDFLSVTPRNATSWLATAFCDESGYVYPDLFAVARKEDGNLSVTRLTDITQQEALEASADDSVILPDDMNPSELEQNDSPAVEDGEAEGGVETEVEATKDAFNTYVRCGDVKP